MGKLLNKDILPDSLLTNITVTNDNGFNKYVLRSIFQLIDHKQVTVIVDLSLQSIATMKFICREATGEYIGQQKYEFNPYIFKKFLKKTFNSYIKDLADKDMVNPYDVVDLINKIRKNYTKVTPILSIGVD